MLTPKLLRVTKQSDGSVAPTWLTARDDVWLRELVAATDAHVGRPVGDLERALAQELATVSRAHRVEQRALRGAIRVALSNFDTASPEGVFSEALRRYLFVEAAKARFSRGSLSTESRQQLLSAAATKFGVSPTCIEALLYADLPKERILRPPPKPLRAESLRDDYHLALVQGLLLRASKVDVWVKAHARSVARFAKLSRLLCTFALEGSATRVTLSGPLAIFHETLKYGRAIARFLPTVVSTPGWRLEARCVVDESQLLLRLDAGMPLPRTHALPQETDSKLEARLVRDLRRLGSAWSLVREAAAFQVGSQVFFPDFVLVRGTTRVVVEVVGYWTAEYLASKLRALASIEGMPLVVVVDETYGIVPEDLPAAELVTFKRWIDPAQVIAAAERVSAARLLGPHQLVAVDQAPQAATPARAKSAVAINAPTSILPSNLGGM